MEMIFHWLWDREAQKQFQIYWKSGKDIIVNYYTKKLQCVSSENAPTFSNAKHGPSVVKSIVKTDAAQI